MCACATSEGKGSSKNFALSKIRSSFGHLQKQLKMASAMNENKKIAIKIRKKELIIIKNIIKKNQQFINGTLQDPLFADVLQNCWCSQRCS